MLSKTSRNSFPILLSSGSWPYLICDVDAALTWMPCFSRACWSASYNCFIDLPQKSDPLLMLSWTKGNSWGMIPNSLSTCHKVIGCCRFLMTVKNSFVLADLLVWTSTDPCVLKADPSADFRVRGAFFMSLLDRPNFGKISGWNAVMLAPVSGNASICCLVPSWISIFTWTSSSFSGFWIDKIFADLGVP